jgi:hypothetical protein
MFASLRSSGLQVMHYAAVYVHRCTPNTHLEHILSISQQLGTDHHEQHVGLPCNPIGQQQRLGPQSGNAQECKVGQVGGKQRMMVKYSTECTLGCTGMSMKPMAACTGFVPRWV